MSNKYSGYTVVRAFAPGGKHLYRQHHGGDTMTQSNGFAPDHYLSRSWALLTRDRGWIKPVLLLALGLLVPIVGPLAVLGYGIEWARLTAWGIDSSPKQKNVDIGKLIASGWRSFVVALGWVLLLIVAEGIIHALFGMTGDGEYSGIQALVELLLFIFNLLYGMVVIVAMLRASIYQKASAGYRFDRVFQMATADFGGLVRVIGIKILGELVTCLAATIGVVIAVLAALPNIFHAFTYGYADTADFMDLLVNVLGIVGPVGVLIGFVLSVIGVVVNLLVVTAVGLWFRQFDVPHWQKSGDPLPKREPSQGNDAPQSPTGFAYTPWQPGPQNGAGFASAEPAANQAPAAAEPTGGQVPRPAATPEAHDAVVPSAGVSETSLVPVPMPPAGGWEGFAPGEVESAEDKPAEGEASGSAEEEHDVAAAEEPMPEEAAVDEDPAANTDAVVTEVIPLAHRTDEATPAADEPAGTTDPADPTPDEE